MFHKNGFQNGFHGTFQKGWALLAWVVITAILLSGCGQAPVAKTYRVGILSGLGVFFGPAADGFKSKMTELGYIEGQNIVYDVQTTDVDMAAYQAITKKFVEDKVDMIFVFPTEASMEAKAATKDTGIPVIFALAFTDVSGVDLIDSIREPGGNITGVRFPSAEIANKRLQILNELVPDAKRIFVPYLKGYPNVPGQLDVIRTQAQSLGLTLIEYGATSPDDLQTGLNGLGTPEDLGLDAILMIAEPLGVTPVFYSILGKFSYEHNLPIGGALMSVDNNYGSIFGVGPDPRSTGVEAALLADKVFRGTPAGTIPVVTSDSVFQIDYRAAQALKVTVPDGLLKQADEIIK